MNGEPNHEKPPIAGEASLEQLKQQVEQLTKECKEHLAGWQRARADLLNYKREERERIEGFVVGVHEALVEKLLPLLDNFEVVEARLPEDIKMNEHVKGLLQIKAQLMDLLKSQGVEAIESLGQRFDPTIHEAVEEIEKEDAESGMVLEEFQKGYRINGRLLRPAKVKVTR